MRRRTAFRNLKPRSLSIPAQRYPIELFCFINKYASPLELGVESSSSVVFRRNYYTSFQFIVMYCHSLIILARSLIGDSAHSGWYSFHLFVFEALVFLDHSEKCVYLVKTPCEDQMQKHPKEGRPVVSLFKKYY